MKRVLLLIVVICVLAMAGPVLAGKVVVIVKDKNGLSRTVIDEGQKPVYNPKTGRYEMPGQTTRLAARTKTSSARSMRFMGVINPKTKEYYPRNGKKSKEFINSATGETFPEKDGGAVNPETGEFYPAYYPEF